MNTAKTSITVNAGRSIVVEPNPTGPGVKFSLVLFGATMANVVLTRSQCQDICYGINEASQADLDRS